MILAIDTSLGTSVAVVEHDGLVRSQVHSDDPLRHAEVIGTLLTEALAAADQTPGTESGITHVAAGMGPGPFTGLRIGIAAARAFARGADGGRGIPVVPVVSHDAAALGILLADPFAEPFAELPRFAVVTDARRREFAYSVYDGLDDDGLPRRVHGPALVHRDEVETVLAGLGAERREMHAVPAAMLGVAAARALAAGREIGPHEALYLRSPDITPAHAPKRVGA